MAADDDGPPKVLGMPVAVELPAEMQGRIVSTHALEPGRFYLINVGDRVTEREMQHFRTALRTLGLNVAVVSVESIQVYELELTRGSNAILVDGRDPAVPAEAKHVEPCGQIFRSMDGAVCRCTQPIGHVEGLHAGPSVNLITSDTALVQAAYEFMQDERLNDSPISCSSCSAGPGQPHRSRCALAR